MRHENWGKFEAHNWGGFNDRSHPCPDFRRDEWPRIRTAAIVFLYEHGEAAVAAGWSAVELFGVDPVVGVARLDRCGALMLGGSRVGSVERDLIRFANGTAFRRKPASTMAMSIPVWEFTEPAASAGRK